MENKLVLELIAKNLEEIKFLFETMLEKEETDNLLLELTTLKAKTLHQELKLLLPKESLVEKEDEEEEVENQTAVDQSDDEVQNQTDAPDSNLQTETTLIEEIVTVTETVTEKIVVADDVLDENNIVDENESLTDETSAEENEIPEQVEEPIPSGDMNDASLPEEELLESIPSSGEQPDENSVHEEQEEDGETGEDKEPEPLQLIEIVSETVIETTTLTETVKEVSEKKVFGDQFVKEPSLNDKLGSANVHETKIKARPIENLKSAIGINDRFLFTRELFGNDSSQYESAVEQLDQFTSILEAIEYLEKNFHWTKNNASLKFMDLVKRRFEK